MPAVLFIVYFLLFGFWLTRMKMVKQCGLALSMVFGLFTIKVLAGIAVGMASHYLLQDKTDYYGTNLNGIVEYGSLINTPKVFFTDLFTSNYSERGEFFGSKSSYWNDLRFNIIYKILAFTNIFSRGNYYINSLFFNFVSHLSTILLYRAFIDVYPSKKWSVIIGCFLLPSTLYFGSGIHKDLIVLTALSVFCYAVYFGLKQGFEWKKIIFLILSFLTILLVRNFIAVILLPCAVTWFISYKYKLSPLKSFATLLMIGVLSTLVLHYGLKNGDPLQIVVNKQQAFFALGKAHTDFQMDTLQPTIKSFVEQSPAALRHSFLSPYPTEFKNVYMNFFSIEMIAYWLLFLLMVFLSVKHKNTNKIFILFGITFAFLIFLFTGYITPAAAALIRYRSIYLLFLVIPIICNIDWNRILKRFNIKY